MGLGHVMKPIKIGSLSVPNRVVRTGHGTGIGGGTMSQALIDYHVARARGGVGLTILELASVHRSAYPFLNAGAPGLVEGYRQLVQRVRPYGMRVFQQIGHLGNEVPQPDGSPPWSSSETIGASLGILAEQISKRCIREFVEQYAAAARDCEEGGLDGIELHMAHGYLVQQFLSPLYNHRTDEYGGSFENRIRFAVELLSAVRGSLKTNLVVGVRLGSELVEGGMGPAEVAAVANRFHAMQLIDYLNLTQGSDHRAHKMIGAMHEPMGYELPGDLPVKLAVSLPVIVTGRFRTLEEADQVIGSGEADMVALTRAHIADTDLVRKTLDGNVDDVRPCIGCNHGCVGGLIEMGKMGCTVNVAVGHEAILSEDLIVPSTDRKKVLVIGGGPAGLEAARVAALKGHHVILAEAMTSLGGSINIARRAPRRHGIGDITEWLERQVYKLGVDVRLSTYIEGADVADIAPNVVILATGSTPRMDGQQYMAPNLVPHGIAQSHVVSSHDLLLEGPNRDWGRSALVFDDVGHYEGVAAAEFLIEKGLAVTFVTSQESFAPKLKSSLSSAPALERLSKGNFRLVTYGKLLSIGTRETEIAHRYGGPSFLTSADTVVFISHNQPNRELLDILMPIGVEIIPVGDVRSPRFLQTAIREGHLAARGIN
jgi:2,4-dienoyl-CoA reductase-like NADH-dependent reductase (Old Yellow Enzyme family)